MLRRALARCYNMLVHLGPLGTAEVEAETNGWKGANQGQTPQAVWHVRRWFEHSNGFVVA